MIVNLKEQHCENFLQSLHKEQWQEVRLGEVAEIFDYQRIPLSTMQRMNRKGAYPYYGASGVIDYIDDFIFDGEFVLISEDGENLRTRKTPIAFKVSGKFWVNNHAHIVKGKKDYFNDLIVYLFENLDLNPYITGAVQPKLNQSTLLNIPLKIPILETTQQKIAEILSSFDDKIVLLHRQNKTLESLALTLFRHYFIDNPNRNEWELGKLGDYVKIIDNRGKTPPFTTDITPYPLIEVNALSDDSMLINYDVVRKYVIKETYQNWFREHIKQYDILLSTVGSIGEVAMLLDNKGCIAQNVIGFRARDISPFYLYEWLKYMQQEIKEFDIGSVQPSIKITHFVEKQIYKPDSKTLESFDKQMLLITNKISHNAKQIQNLQAMRDMLLKAIFA